MSAASIIVRGQAAYLLSDAASYAFDGTILELGSKVVRSSRLRMAITVSGLATSETSEKIAKWFGLHDDTDRAIADLPNLAAHLEQYNIECRTAADPTKGIPDFIQLHVAAYSRRRGRPGGFICGSAAGTFSADYEPLTVRGVQDILSPAVDRNLCPDDGFDALKHGQAILAAQRTHRHETGTYNVGGWGELTTVDSKGVNTRTIIRWPDRVGERITAKL